MSKLPNIIQRRELEPLLFKADKVAKLYEKAADCPVSVMGPDSVSCSDQMNPVCRQCKRNASFDTACCRLHRESVKEAKKTRGTHKYMCPEGYIFWTSPFYSGELFAGALLSGGIKTSVTNNCKIKALANMMSMCTDQLSKSVPLSYFYINKNTTAQDYTYLDEDKEKKVKNNNNINTLDMERKLMATLRRGDNNEAQKLLNNLLITHFQESGLNFSAFKLKAIELAVLLSRSIYDPDTTIDNTVFEANNRYLKKIEASSQFEEIKQILCVITENMSEKIFSFHGVRHFSALRKAERFIWENYTRKLSLQEIAEASGLSAPYFSTIFKEEMGENLSNYLNKLRVEKAASMLVSTTLPISEVSAACGFEDQSWFSKIFKNNTGLTPGKYREDRYGG